MSPIALVLTAVVLFGLSALFVMAEYALFGVRRAKMSSLAEKGSGPARLMVEAIDDRSRYVAGIQVGITILGIASGSFLEPAITDILDNALSWMPKQVITGLSIILVAYPLVVLSELVPKYVTIRFPEPVALALIRPLRLYILLAAPLTWLFQKSSALVMRPFGFVVGGKESEAVSREELVGMLEAGESEGQFVENHADVILRALRLDRLDAKDVMVHRLDMESLPVQLPRADLFDHLKRMKHSRIPVYGEDLDDIRGIAYLQDIFARWEDQESSLEKVMRPAAFVPTSLTLDRCLHTMRTQKTQILIVQDEYGGTSGMLTLEDLVEEIFGDLQDQPETDKPLIERVGRNRLRISPKVRWDELLRFLDETIDDDTSTDTLSTMVLDELERIPRQGDFIDTPLGRLVVEQTTRSRIIQLGLLLPSDDSVG